VIPLDISTLSPEELQKLFHELRNHQVELESQNEELRKVQGELSESRDRYLELYELAPVGYLTVSKACNILEANQTVSRLLGMERDQLIGKSLYRLIAKEDQDFFYFHLMTVFRNQASKTCELKLKRNDGTEFYAEIQSHALKGINGACDSFRTIVSDITQRKESEILQLKLQQNLESLWELSRIQNNNLKSLADHVLEEIKKISESRYAFYGFINHEETEMEIYSWSNEAMNQCKIDDKPKFFPIAKAGIWGRVVRQRETVIINDYGQDHEGKRGLPEGHVRLTRFVAIPVFNKGKIVAVGAVANKKSDYTEDDVKQLEAFLSHAQIIAEQKRAQKDLKESELKFRTVADFTCDWEYWIGPDGALIYISPSCETITGYHRDEFLNNPKLLSEIVHPEDQAIAVNHVAIIDENDCNSADFRIVTRTGEERWIAHRCQAVFGDNGSWLGRRVSNRDITQRKLAEKALRKSEANLSSLFNTISERVFLMKPDGKILAANEPFATGLGKTVEDVIGHCVFDYLEPSVTERRRAWINEVVSAGKPMRIEDKRQDSIVVHNIYPILNSDGAVDRLAVYAVDVTAVRRSESALKESEDRFRLFVEAANEGVWSMDGQFRTTFVNRKMADMLGFSPEEMLGRTVDSFMFEEDSLDHEARMAKRQLGRNDSYERRFRRKDGAEVWMLVSATSLVDKNLAFQGSFAMFTDITERKLSQAVLRKSEERYRNLFENMIEGFAFHKMLYDDYGRPADYVFLNVNTAFEHLTGLSSVVGQRVTDVMPGIKDAHPELFEIYGKVAMTCQAIRFEFYAESLQSWFDVAAHSPERDYFVTVFENITERKLLEKELTESEEKFAKAFNCAPALMTLSKADDGTILDVNDKFCEVSGFSRAECIGRTSLDVGWLLPEDRTRLIEELQAHGSVRDMDLKAQTINKKEIELIYSGELMQTASHKLLLSTALDVTERNRAEKSRKLLSAAIEQSAEAVIITDANGTIQYVNPAQEILSGYNHDELIGRTPNVLKNDFHDVDFHKQLWDTIGVGEAWSGRFVNKKKDGTEYHEDASISPVYDKSGNLTNFVAVKHDVTKQVALQEQLLHAQKMEAIGTLAGGFAHDFNNKLQVIDGYVDLMLFDKDLPETLKQDMRIIKQAVDSSAELIRGMMVFSRKTPIDLLPIDLNKLVAQTGSMLARSISKMIEIDLLLADDLWAIKAAPNQIDQILMNLAVNARDAMPDGGRLTIETKNIVLDEEYCSFDPLVKPGRYVLIEVSDTGTGMDKETASHIFEPFFTTKEAVKGTGLGLAVVYGIVEQHGARIICDSAPSVGTTFRIYFPAIEEVHEEEYFENKEPPRGQGETLLLVDDEPNLVVIVSRQLVGANYRVIKASNGNEALNLYEKHREEIRLVILDLLMPGMSGKQCLEALLKLDPNVRVLVASGAMNSAIEADLKEIGAKGLIAKPFETSQLLEEIRKIIDED